MRESGVDEYRSFGVCSRVLHLDEEGDEKKKVYWSGAASEVDGLSLPGEKAPGASFVTTAVAFRLKVLHFLFTPVCISL